MQAPPPPGSISEGLLQPKNLENKLDAPKLRKEGRNPRTLIGLETGTYSIRYGEVVSSGWRTMTKLDFILGEVRDNHFSNCTILPNR